MIKIFLLIASIWTNLCLGQFTSFQQRPLGPFENFGRNSHRQPFINNQNYNQLHDQSRFRIFNNQDIPPSLLLPPPEPPVTPGPLGAHNSVAITQSKPLSLPFQQQAQSQQPVVNNFRFPPPAIDPKIPDLLFTQEQNKQLYEYFEHQKRLKELQQKQKQIEEQKELLEREYEKTIQNVHESNPDIFFNKYSSNTGNNSVLVGPSQENFYHVLPQKLPLVQSSVTPTKTTTIKTTTVSTTTTTAKPTTVKFQAKKSTFLPTIIPEESQKSSKKHGIETVEELNYLQKQYEQNLLNKDDLLQQIKSAIEKTGDNDKNFTTREISLANGQKVQVIQTSDPDIIQKAAQNPNAIIETSTKPAKEILEELTKNIIPPGVNFELLKSTDNGKFEEIGTGNLSMMNLIAQQKKITFVLLEEQDDGSLKVQGIKGNGDVEKNLDAGKLSTGSELESILTKLKNGEIHLPSSKIHKKTASASNYYKKKPQKISTSVKFYDENKSSTKATKKTSLDDRVHKKNNILTTLEPIEIEPLKESPSTNNLHNAFIKSSIYSKQSTIAEISTTPITTTETTPVLKNNSLPLINSNLVDILRKNELFAMAKYLKQSSLDAVLNDTGPFTMFVPNDKAFKSLMIQLGGPEKAEDKFRQNPRLLSGLLLHHIIPSAFEISSLQDEMTGVSLAGTQLRVNQYYMKDNEWNDIQITTINGAKIIDDRKDFRIPQGIAHTVDRVMFPLPVGDLLQTLQTDREKRFTNFTTAILIAGLTDVLQGQKTYTVFAPMDTSFELLTHEELSRIVNNKEIARDFVLSYIVPGALYTSGMQYYQVRDTLLPEKSLTLIKNSGMVFYFESHVVSPPYKLYMGDDEYENDELIKFGWPEDVWFHLSKFSSAHVYLRLRKGDTIDDIPQSVLDDAAQLVKANSINGNKLNNVEVVYTYWSNLKKEPDMEVGQVGFHNNKAIYTMYVSNRNKEILNRLNKTKKELRLNLKEERDQRNHKERILQKKLRRENNKLKIEAENAKREKEKLKCYESLMNIEKMTLNTDCGGNDSDDFM